MIRYFCVALITLGLMTTTASTVWTGEAQPSHPHRSRMSDRQALHLLNRLTYGPKPGDLERVKQIGFEAFVRNQLNPGSLALSPELSHQLTSLPSQRMSPLDLFKTYVAPVKLAKQQKKKKQKNNQRTGVDSDQSANDPVKEVRKQAKLVLRESSEAHLAQALESPRQLEALMTDFWFNHFNVFAGKGINYAWVGSYEKEAIQPYVFGNFRDLLGATAHHPAMLFYLDNWMNTAPGSKGARGQFKGLNENYARELLELHTLGVDGGYTQKDVEELARVLTGWGIINRRAALKNIRTRKSASLNASGFYFDASRHDYGDKIILGHRIKGTGAQEVEQVLDMLAAHPSTARHISFKLAQYFVADDPPESLVNRLTEQYMYSRGNIRSMLYVLFHSPEFWDPAYEKKKFKSPKRYVISSLRASGVPVKNYKMLAGLLKQYEMPLYGCLTPDGYKNTEEAWLSPNTMINRLSFATALANGSLPLQSKRRGQDALDPVILSDTLGYPFSERTLEALEQAPTEMQAAMMLGSPEFMKF